MRLIAAMLFMCFAGVFANTIDLLRTYPAHYGHFEEIANDDGSPKVNYHHDEDDSKFPAKYIDDINDTTNDIEPATIHKRTRRQAFQAADLALRHEDRNGKPFSVGRIHGRFDAQGSGRNLNNYHVNAGLGLGTVLWRSPNGRHSVGAGAYAAQSRGRFQGFKYQSPRRYGGGIGYKFRF